MLRHYFSGLHTKLFGRKDIRCVDNISNDAKELWLDYDNTVGNVLLWLIYSVQLQHSDQISWEYYLRGHLQLPNYSHNPNDVHIGCDPPTHLTTPLIQAKWLDVQVIHDAWSHNSISTNKGTVCVKYFDEHDLTWPRSYYFMVISIGFGQLLMNSLLNVVAVLE